MVRIIGIVSGKGGVGKTTLTANLGAALAKYFEKRVLLTDFNFGFSDLAYYLNLYYYPFTLTDFLERKKKIEEVIYSNPFLKVKFLPSLNFNLLEKNLNKIKKTLKKLEFDFILLDSAPGLKETSYIVPLVEEFIVVTSLDHFSFFETKNLLEKLRRTRKKILGIVINKKGESKFEVEVERIKELKEKILGIIPYHKDFQKSVKEKLVLIEKNEKFARLFYSIARNVLFG